MKVFGGFLLFAQNGARAECGPGMATGINASGEPDASNTATCYPTSAAANIVSCNNPDTQAAEMKIAIEKAFYESNLNDLTGFVEESGNYVKNVTFMDDGSNKKVTTDGDYIELFMSISTDAEYGTAQGQQLQIASQKSLEFACKYSLAVQTISSGSTTASGSDITINRTSTGQLYYNIIADDTSVVGQKKNFSIVPVTPGVVYSRVESCEVLNEKESNQFSLIENRTSGTCTDWLTGFTNESGSWSSDQQQDFSFTTFKWDSTKASENQTIQCQIKLETSHDATYNPSECDQAFDECAAGTHNCDANAECTDTDDAFTCECNDGYSGDGVTCAVEAPSGLDLIPSNGKVIAENVSFGKEWKVSFDFKPGANQVAQDYTSIIRFTNGSANSGACGTRYPGVWLNGDRRGDGLLISSCVNDNPNYFTDGLMWDTGFRNSWNSIEIGQRKKIDAAGNEVFYHFVNYNGKLHKETINENPKEITDLKVYAGDLFYDAANGEIRNLIWGDYSE